MMRPYNSVRDVVCTAAGFLPKLLLKARGDKLTYGDVSESLPESFNYAVVGRSIGARCVREDAVGEKEVFADLHVVKFSHVTDDEDRAEVWVRGSKGNYVFLYP